MFLETGTVLNNIYRVVRLLGKGSMGNVYLVERIEDDKQFVVKELVFSKEANLDVEHGREIFFREAEFMVKFNHRGLPKMYGVFSQNGREYLTMDYIEGKTLEEIINSLKDPLTEKQAITLTVKIAEILDYLHNAFHAPVIYRDLKPSNIIITPQGEPKLVDFGIARYYNPDKGTDTFKYGSPGYAAPEQYKGRGQTTPVSDIYGLGVILYQMLTNYDPTLKLFQFPPLRSLNPSVSNEVEAIVKRAIDLDPMKRYISMKEFKEILEKHGKPYGKYIKEKENKKSNNFSTAGIMLAVLSIFSPYIISMIISMSDGVIKNFSPDIRIFLRNLFFMVPLIMVLLPVTGLILSIVGSRRAKEGERDGLAPTAIGCNFMAMIVMVLLCLIFVPGSLKVRAMTRLANCESNIKNMATALELYAEDNKGHYPPALSYLTDKKSGKPYKIPECPSCFTGYEYVCNSSHNNFTLWCKLNNAHIVATGKEGSWPQYNPAQGLILP